jgi:beta-phosphoglucomutase-like phosphatase (HAD superfamily)
MKSKYTNKKLILSDCDGVLLDWEWAFDVWMQEHGFEEVAGSKLNYDMAVRYGISKEQVTKLIRIFNESAAIGFLPALRDAVFYVKRLHEEHSYVFHCITSLSLDANAQRLRKMNLQKLFGKTVFERIVCLDTGADKQEVLEEYKGTGLIWIEDKPENAIAGYNAGLQSLLVQHEHNMNYQQEGVTVVKNWKHIYEIIAG